MRVILYELRRRRYRHRVALRWCGRGGQGHRQEFHLYVGQE